PPNVARDPHVIFAEDFETGSVADLARRWDDVSNPGGKVLAFSADVPPESAGRRSLQMTATLGENTGGHPYRQLPQSAATGCPRFCVKFAPNAEYLHRCVARGGSPPAARYPQGGAGERPRGDDRVTAGIEPYGDHGRFAPPGVWGFYAYWQQ